ncbi:hypothetical protein SAY87_004838 [Trapa incisa]|uniref:Uncharacterized protein n=1 Tax=Trapa incisa TaxID=236973 RepID=A0AAN7JPL8_9MYRT|nr:hypothetical protein SAY87_004838 [Trapa incisa]
MRREGRQHGTVRTYRVLPAPYNLREGSRLVNRLESPPSFGLFARVPSKPTNHSKFTGKCGKGKCTECHLGPVHKSKDKAKGSQRLKSTDRLVTWRVIDGGPGGSCSSGLSATVLLDHLSNHCTFDEDEEESYVDDEDEYHDLEDGAPEVEEDNGDEAVGEGFRVRGNINEDYMGMGFRDARMLVEDEGWCVVGQNTSTVE